MVNNLISKKEVHTRVVGCWYWSSVKLVRQSAFGIQIIHRAMTQSLNTMLAGIRLKTELWQLLFKCRQSV